MRSSVSDFPANPYVGPRAFGSTERKVFFGRDREIRELADLLISERVILLHAPSGAGKTSLLRAGLLPKLAEDFDILPLTRVAQQVPPSTAANRYVLSTLLSWEQDESSTATTRDAGELAQSTLAGYLSERSRRGTEKPPLLVFDQFEEVLTADDRDAEAKEAFFSQLGEVLRRTRGGPAQEVRWAIFAFREEYLAALQPRFLKLPGLAPETYRLELLGAGAALEAIQNPAQAAGITFHLEASKQLVDNLRRVHGEHGDGECQDHQMVLGDYIEPVQLQVVCFRLWEKLAAQQLRVVDRDTIVKLADVDNALSGYYADKLREICESSEDSELEIRTWFSERLITADGHRAMVQLESGRADDLTADTIEALQDTFLVRREERRGLSWLELAHDRLVEPIRQENDRWFAERLQPFQLQASQWQRLGQTNELLLRGLSLYQAERWQIYHADSLRPLDKLFLEASRRVVSTVDAFKMRYFRWWAYLASAAVVAVTVYAVMAVRQARSLARKAENDVAEAKQRYDEYVIQQALVQDRLRTLTQEKEAADQRAVDANRLADDAQQQLNQLTSQKASTEEDLTDRMLTVLRVPMQSAAALATARNEQAAEVALANWERLIELLGPSKTGVDPTQFAAWLRNVRRIIAEAPDDQPFPDETQRQLAYETLRLSRDYGEQFLQSVSADNTDLIQKLQQRLYNDAIQVTAELSDTLSSPADLTNPDFTERVDRFWQLYYGELPAVEGEAVARAMIDFGAALKERAADRDEYRNRLRTSAEAVRRACEREQRGVKTKL